MRWTLAAAAVLIACAAYELVLALGWVEIGGVPGADAPGAGVAFAAAALALLAGAGLSLRRPAWPLAPAAALFLVAFEYTFDPYFAPTRRRYSDGAVRPAWMFGLLVASAGPALLARRRGNGAGIVNTLYLLVALVTLIVTPTGH